MKPLDDITGAVVDAAMKIHMELGPGLLESVYEAVLARALAKRVFQVERQKPILFEYDGMVFEEGFRTDLLVDGRVIVELKSVEKLACPQQTTAHLSPADASASRTAHQLWRGDAQGGTAPRGEPSRSLRVSAPPREPICAVMKNTMPFSPWGGSRN